jgi:hypothetical protein
MLKVQAVPEARGRTRFKPDLEWIDTAPIPMNPIERPSLYLGFKTSGGGTRGVD